MLVYNMVLSSSDAIFLYDHGFYCTHAFEQLAFLVAGNFIS